MDKTSLTDAQAINLLQVARTALASALSASVEPKYRFDDPVLLPEMVNVTLYHCGQLQASMSGRGSTLTEAVIVASQRTVVDDRFRPRLTLTDLPDVRNRSLDISELGTTLNPRYCL